MVSPLETSPSDPANGRGRLVQIRLCRIQFSEVGVGVVEIDLHPPLPARTFPPNPFDQLPTIVPAEIQHRAPLPPPCCPRPSELLYLLFVLEPQLAAARSLPLHALHLASP